MKNYDDIINLPHHVSSKHSHMTLIERAGQFNPFAALNGYSDAIGETGRIVDEKTELSEYEKEVINEKLNFIKNYQQEIAISVTYFVKDELKKGGKYLTERLVVRKVDEFKKLLEFTNGFKLLFDDILDLNCEQFDNEI